MCFIPISIHVFVTINEGAAAWSFGIRSGS
jgi:hypothetical protein